VDAPEPPQNEAPAAAAVPAGRGLASEELARIRGLPLVRGALSAFGGRIEQVFRQGEG
jgi:hypothetical protein